MNQDQLDLRERGQSASGEVIYSDRRLYLQLVVYGRCSELEPIKEALQTAEVEGALYKDVNDPTGLGVLALHEDPSFFVETWRDILAAPPFDSLAQKHELTMMGRTYSIGYEADLEHTLLRRPRQRISNPAWPWAIWYPLRRHGAFEMLPGEERRNMLKEHGGIGAKFSASDHAYDIRLSCHGLDTNDNDFVVGLVGKELFPLSALVQTMRKTQQTSTYLQHLGPFFIGKSVWSHSNT